MSNLNEQDIAILTGNPVKGDVIYTREMQWKQYDDEYGWIAIPAADVPLDDLLLCYEDLIIELSQKETEHIEVKEDYDSKEFEIVYMSDIDFKKLYGSTAEKVRK